ncbi:flavohemo protein [Saccharata proteae CBS 121410]|uniref:nitric oxide dioxygenase n=1 Tax=Saccharata proteae CBS 121410 TaxID=1314787 RepID=A0A6A5YDJ7_9PEZI|nr:flavohemo protein [Saccharata proteae CBS 121410]
MATLTPSQAGIIKATVPILAEHGKTITTTFYENLLRDNPSLNNVFNTANQANGHQPRALATALYAYAANIDDLGALSPALELICHKHASLYIRPEQYDIVGTYLLAAMKEVLGDALTPDVLDAWTAAYTQLANVMIGQEAQLYHEAEGWTDWRDFRISRKERESEDITSFYLVPADGGKLPRFEPGQYVSVGTEVPGRGYFQARQYSLSDAPGKEYYRISVKKDSGISPATNNPNSPAHPGFLSNHLHTSTSTGTILSLSHPAGPFHLPASLPPTTPIVLISAGVGITPLLSIFNTLTPPSSPSPNPITLIHGARSAVHRPFTQHLRRTAASQENVRVALFASAPGATEVQGQDYDHSGRVDLEQLCGDEADLLWLGSKETRYMVCGPEGFMRGVGAWLEGRGVEGERVLMELFGTGAGSQ